MKNNIFKTSLFTLLCGCTEINSINNDKFYDGYKVYDSEQIKLCGAKNIFGKHFQRCDKKTGELLNGVVLEKDKSSEDIIEHNNFFKNGLPEKIEEYKNGTLIHKYIAEINPTTYIKNSKSEKFFDNGNIKSIYEETWDYINQKRIKSNNKCFYITGKQKCYSTTEEGKEGNAADYDVNGNLILIAKKPVNKNAENKPKEQIGFEDEIIDTWIRYNPDGTLYNGEIVYYFSKDPSKISSKANIKNGKLDGEKINYSFDKNESQIKETIYKSNNGKLFYSKSIYWDANKKPNEQYFTEENKITINYNVDEIPTVYCHYKNNNTQICVHNASAKDFIAKFKKDTTKSLCPDISKFK